MADLKNLGKDAVDQDPDEQPSQLLACTVNRPPAEETDPLTVIIDAFSDQHETEVTCWMPRGDVFPASGDRGYAALGDDGEWLLVAWRPGT